MTATTPTSTVPQPPLLTSDVRKQPLSTALPAVRDEEAVGSNPATPTMFDQLRGLLVQESGLLIV